MIINLTQHNATQDQIDDNVKDIVSPIENALLKETLTFTTLPSRMAIQIKVESLVSIATRAILAELALKTTQSDVDIAMLALVPHPAYRATAIKHFNFKAMIGGAPYLMGPLAKALWEAGIEPVYAYSERVSTEKHGEDGKVDKTNVFKHIGFISGI